MAFITKLSSQNKLDLNNFLTAIFHDRHDDEEIFLTSHSEQIKGETPWPYKSLSQLLDSSVNNTYHYCISTFQKNEQNKIRRQITQFKALHVIVLDDIGTKVKPPTLEPSYILETSKDNYQYGYILDGAIRDRNIASALIQTIYSTNAKLSDSGGKALTKMVKLPIGKNLKDGRHNFPQTLHHFKPTIQYNYFDLLSNWALTEQFKTNLISGRTIAHPYQRMEQQLTDQDIVFQWLSDNNYITKDNGNGYFQCICPKGHLHSDNQPSSGSAYKPLGFGEKPNERHFKCHHEHEGESPTTEDFLLFIRDAGGPIAGITARQTGDNINYMEMAPLGIYPDIYTSMQTGKISVKQTIENLNALLDWYGLKPQRNVFRDEPTLVDDNNKQYTAIDIYSLTKRNMLPYASGDIDQFIDAMSMNYLTNPVLDYIKALPYNGTNHIASVFNLIPIADHNEEHLPLLRLLWRKWVIQCVAAADAGINTPNKEAIPKYESTMILVGGQGVRKTSFLRSIVPPQLKPYFCEGALLNLKDKDSIIKARSYWICELGELDATFRRSDISELKAYLSSTNDQYRAPYGRIQRTWPRRTSFCASVNETKFLHDFTGNRRFWTIEIADQIQWPDEQLVNNMWAEAYDAYIKGESWWITYEETQMSENYVKQFSSANDEWFVHDIYNIFNLIDNPDLLAECAKALKVHKTALLYDEHNKTDFKAYTTHELLAMSDKVSMNVKPNRYTSMLKNSDIPSAKLYNNRLYFILPKKVKKY